MQVPEKLALIGGSILLSSILIFTLKSQASQIVPSVGHSISHVFDHIGDAQKASDFDNNYQKAKKNGWTTGTWGTAKFYIDKDNNMYINNGKLSSPLIDNIGQDKFYSLKTINLEGRIEAPQDSTRLFGGREGQINSSITSINGLDDLDTKSVTNMYGMFANNKALQNINVNNWDTSQLENMDHIFRNTSLSNIDLSNWQTPKLISSKNAFMDDSSLQYLNISKMDTTKSNMNFLFGGQWASPTSGNLSKIVLGDKVYLQNIIGIYGQWKNGSQILSGTDLINSWPNSGQSHPGTWIKQ